jgi:hypothetical protein
MINDVNSLLLLLTLFDQIILTIFNLEWNVLFCFSILLMIFCWLIVWTSITRISWINILNVLRIKYVDEIIFLAKISLIITQFLIFFVFVIIFTSSLDKQRVVNTFFLFSRFFANVLSIFWSIKFLNLSFRVVFWF